MGAAAPQEDMWPVQQGTWANWPLQGPERSLRSARLVTLTSGLYISYLELLFLRTEKSQEDLGLRSVG